MPVSVDCITWGRGGDADRGLGTAYELTLAQGLNFERRLFHSLFSTKDQKEGASRFVSGIREERNLRYTVRNGRILGKEEAKLLAPLKRTHTAVPCTLYYLFPAIDHLFALPSKLGSMHKGSSS